MFDGFWDDDVDEIDTETLKQWFRLLKSKDLNELEIQMERELRDRGANF